MINGTGVESRDLYIHRGPDLHMDWDKMAGEPYAYFTYGVCCSEVELDCLSGNYQVHPAHMLW